jgi:hypothetical protein
MMSWDKRPRRTFSEMVHQPLSIIGFILATGALIAQAYLPGPHP